MDVMTLEVGKAYLTGLDEKVIITGTCVVPGLYNSFDDYVYNYIDNLKHTYDKSGFFTDNQGRRMADLIVERPTEFEAATDPLTWDLVKEIPVQEYHTDQFVQSLNTNPALAFDILREWGEKTFGPVIPERIVERAAEEMFKELIPAVEGKAEWSENALEEAADVVVILTRAPGLWNAIVRKMAINFERKWDVRGDGTGYKLIEQPVES